MSPSAAITGLGAVSCFGVGTGALLSAMLEGRDGLRPIERFSTRGFGVSRAALVPPLDRDLEDIAGTEATPRALLERYGLAAAREARADAGLDAETYRASRTALVLGTSPADSVALVHEISEKLGNALGALGPRLTVSTACSSSTNAVGLGADLLATGDADVVFAGGVDVVTPLLFAGFHVLGVLSTEHCAPFSEPMGTVLGEGAGFVVLEREQAVLERGARPRARLLGYGLSCDAFHETSPDPTGSGVARAAVLALRAAGLGPQSIDYVNAHGTGTAANDPAEWRALLRVLGARAATTPISSSKSFLGHAQAAAGILELLATLLCLERGLVPHTLHHDRSRPHSPPDAVGGSAPRPVSVRYALSTNSAFAGANAALAIATPTAPVPACATFERRPVWVSAFSSIERGEGAAEPLTRAELLERIAGVDATGNDRSTLLLLALTQRLLSAAGSRSARAERERTGLVVGVTRISPESLADVQESVRARGLLRVAPVGFSRMVLSAPAGACARAFQLKGPMSTLSSGASSGLSALIYAARLVEMDQADAMLGIGVDEAPALGESKATATDGAAGALLTTGPLESDGPRVRWAGAGFAGPGRYDEAIRQALGASGIDWNSLDLVISDRPGHFRSRAREVALGEGDGHPAASTTAFGLVLAARALSTGEAQRAIVLGGRGDSASCATVLVREAS